MTSLSQCIATAQKDLTLFRMANCLRSLAIDAVEKAQSGHPGAPMGLADAATVLWSKHLKFDPQAADWPDRDRFVLSNGHASMLLYSVLYLTGYPSMTLDDIKAFRQWGSSTPGHPEYGHTQGVEVTTGPLGQGLASAVGMAIAERSLQARFGQDLVDHRTWVICGDGCLMEGISQEAISLAGHLKLDKLTVLFDDNGISIDGSTDKAFTEDVAGRFEACDWHVISCDGHDHEAIDRAIVAACQETGKPSLVKLRTLIGFGSPNKSGQESSHGAPLGSDERRKTLDALGWVAEPFDIPDTERQAWLKTAQDGQQAHQEWQKRLETADDETREAFLRQTAGRLPETVSAAVQAAKQSLIEQRPSLATRKASQMALSQLAEQIPELIGGSADLTGSNLTRVDAVGKDFQAGTAEGRYLSYGVREFGMAAMMNGIAAHGGLVPYGGTFFVFSDYARNAIRLSALMKLGVIYVMTHDSIGLGEDGPTHQPVEHLASFRAMPGVTVLRPADAVETLEAWQVAVNSRHTPTMLVLSRQAVPALRTQAGDNLTARGAYVIREPGQQRDATIIATGTEVSLAVQAAEKLHEQGINAAVVSMPSWELFEQMDAPYRDEVLGEAPRIAVEAASTFGWSRYVGSESNVVGLSDFGASAPADRLYQHYQITEEAIIARVQGLLGVHS